MLVVGLIFAEWYHVVHPTSCGTSVKSSNWAAVVASVATIIASASNLPRDVLMTLFLMELTLRTSMDTIIVIAMAMATDITMDMDMGMV